MSWEAFVLGVGDAFTEKHLPTALLLQCHGHYLAIDCPDRYRAVLANLRGHTGGNHRLASIDDFLITHVHGDHMNGLEGVAFYKRFVHGRRVRLHAVPEVRAAIWDERLRGSMGVLWDGTTLQPKSFDDYFEFSALSWDARSQVGPFQITARPTRHHVPTSALLVEAYGAVLGYSSDTAYDPGLIEFLEPADLIVYETNLGPSHTDLARLLELPELVRDKIRLVHSTPTALMQTHRRSRRCERATCSFSETRRVEDAANCSISHWLGSASRHRGNRCVEIGGDRQTGRVGLFFALSKRQAAVEHRYRQQL